MANKDFADMGKFLERYRQKRDFQKTSEPRGSKSALKPIGKNPRFVVHEHFATHHHFDLRLENHGVLRSWAVPKQIPLKPGEKFLAVRVEDHPLEYINFQGIISQGEYGAGRVKIWDTGEYALRHSSPTKILLEFDGEKMKGNYALLKFKNGDNWLLLKEKELKSEIIKKNKYDERGMSYAVKVKSKKSKSHKK